MIHLKSGFALSLCFATLLCWQLACVSDTIAADSAIESDPWKLLSHAKDANRKPDLIFDILLKDCPFCTRTSFEIYEVGVVIRHGNSMSDRWNICTKKAEVDSLRKEI